MAHWQTAGRPDGRPAFIEAGFSGPVATGDGASGEARIVGDMIVLARPVGGKPMMVAIPARLFRGVMLDHDGSNHVVRLVHEQPGLTIEIAAGTELADALSAHDRLAAMLGLPVLPSEEDAPQGLDGIAAGDPLAAGGPLAVGDPLPRRSGPRLVRRARFLKRRSVGNASAPRAPIAAPEIIARR